ASHLDIHNRPPDSLCTLLLFLFHAPATTNLYTLSLHDALPIYTLLSVANHCLASTGYINVIVSDKQKHLQYMTMDEAIVHCTKRSEEHTSELQSRFELVCRLLLEKKNPHSPIRTRHRQEPL